MPPTRETEVMLVLTLRMLLTMTTLAALTALVPTGCGIGDIPFDGLGADDPATLPTSPTWANDIAPRMDYYCNACHDADASRGAIKGYDFSLYNLVRGAMLEIERTAITERSMPPGGRAKLTARDWAILLRWKETGFSE